MHLLGIQCVSTDVNIFSSNATNIMYTSWPMISELAVGWFGCAEGQNSKRVIAQAISFYRLPCNNKRKEEGE